MRTALIAVSLSAILAVTALLSSPRALADAPAVGSLAPAFALQDQNGETHKLSDYKGSWVVLYFYPKDDTPGCTTEACSLRDNIFAYRRAGATILGISVDDVESHKAFASKHSLPFTLLADPTKQTARDYGVLVKMLGVFEVAQRDTYLIDPQGRIVRHWPKVDPKDHSDMVLKELLALQGGKSAP